jgi:L-lactate dehydrogenase complex protein LldG
VNRAREEILGRLRAALGDVPEGERSEDVTVNRDYRRVGAAPRAELVARFAERVREYRAPVWLVGRGELAATIAERLAARGVRRLVAPYGLPEEWIPEGLEALRDGAPPLASRELDVSDGVLTGCALGIAQTGTIVLDGGSGQGRRTLTLLPDYHLCVVRDDQLVELVPEAVARLGEAALDPAPPLTFISGPSATSDIELLRVEGVHGPRTLEVLVVR